MTSYQQWFDKQYPAKQRSTITNLEVQKSNNPYSIYGSLKLIGFINLKSLNSRESNVNSLDLSLCHNLEELDCSSHQSQVQIPQQNNQNNRYGYNKNNQVWEGAPLTSLNINNLTNLTKLNCSNNGLSKLDFLLNLNQRSLTYLDVSENQFSGQDLSVLAKFVNLEELLLNVKSNYAGCTGNLKILQNLSKLKRLNLANNRISGSLESLEKMTNLKFLDISNNDIDSGLEYLPEGLEKFIYLQPDQMQGNYFILTNPYTRIYKIIQELMPYDNFQAWKEDNLEKIANARQARASDSQLEISQPKIIKVKSKPVETFELLKSRLVELNSVVLPNDDFDFDNLKEEIKRLKLKEFAPYFQEQEDKFIQLVTKSKEKTGDSFEKIVDLLLETQKVLVSEKEKSSDAVLQAQLNGQLIAYKNILEMKLDEEELQNLLTKQTEFLQLEKQLANLQLQEEQQSQE